MKHLLPLFLSLFWATTSYAQDRAVQDIPEGEDRIVAVKKGEPAPYEGQLFDNPTALRWANWLRQYELKLDADLDYARKVCEAEIRYKGELLSIEEQRYAVVTKMYQLEVAEKETQISQLRFELSHTPWYRSTWFGVTVGAVAMGAAIGTGYFLSR